MTTHDELLDNVAAYALGLLAPSEAAAIAKHLETCEQCRAEYEFLRPAVTAVAYSAESCDDAGSGAAVASPLLKARVMKAVRGEAGPKPRQQFWPAYAVAAACLAIALVTGLVDLSLNSQLARDRAQNLVQAQTIADLAASDSQRHPFAGGEVLTRGARLYLAMHDLPAPPPGRVYQAWTLAKGAKAVAPSVTFSPSGGGVAVVRLPEVATTVAAVAVSVEPEGGSQQPTTKPIALVKI
jgi:anti-sigma-K factor RskA